MELDELGTFNTGGADTAVARFYMHAVKDEAKSTEAGRPVYVEKEYIEIRNPGDKTNIIQRPVRRKDKERFSGAYRNWSETKKNAVSGTPLAEWPTVDRGQVEELAYHGVATVEQLATLSDERMRHIGAFSSLRQKARDFLGAAKSNAGLLKLRAELDARDGELAALRKQAAEQAADLAALKERILAGAAPVAPAAVVAEAASEPAGKRAAGKR